MAQRSPEKGLRLRPLDVWQDNQPGMDVLPRGKVAEVATVLCDEDEIVVDAPV